MPAPVPNVWHRMSKLLRLPRIFQGTLSTAAPAPESAIPLSREQRLVALWRKAGLKIRPPVLPCEIDAFESKYGVAMPSDLRAYFLTVDGMEDQLDPGMNRFWPLGILQPVEEVVATGDRLAYPDCFLIVDHCIWCLAWAVRLGGQQTEVSGPVFQVTANDVPGRQVASSFATFLDTYLEDQWSAL